MSVCVHALAGDRYEASYVTGVLLGLLRSGKRIHCIRARGSAVMPALILGRTRQRRAGQLSRVVYDQLTAWFSRNDYYAVCCSRFRSLCRHPMTLFQPWLLEYAHLLKRDHQNRVGDTRIWIGYTLGQRACLTERDDFYEACAANLCLPEYFAPVRGIRSGLLADPLGIQSPCVEEEEEKKMRSPAPRMGGGILKVEERKGSPRTRLLIDAYTRAPAPHMEQAHMGWSVLQQKNRFFRDVVHLYAGGLRPDAVGGGDPMEAVDRKRVQQFLEKGNATQCKRPIFIT